MLEILRASDPFGIVEAHITEGVNLLSITLPSIFTSRSNTKLHLFLAWYAICTAIF